MEKFRVNGETRIINEEYDYTCPLKHEHKIKVSFNFAKNTFIISKEHHPSKEKQVEVRNKITNLCEEKPCKFCKGKIGLRAKELGGFENERANHYNIETPICSDCWDMKYLTYLQYEDQEFISLDNYLRMEDIIGNEELKDCPAFAGYPRIGKEDNLEVFSQFDLNLITKFKEKVDIEWERDSGPVTIIEEPTKEELLHKDIEEAKCKHVWRLSGPKRQRCNKCFKLKENKKGGK